MTVAVIPNRPAGSDPRSISAILADFDAITNVINGNLDFASNFAPGVALELFVTGTRRKVKWGGPVNTSVGLDSAASRSSLNDTVAHGMGSTPVWAMVLAGGRVSIQEAVYTVVPAGAVTGLTATNINFSFTVNGTSNNGFAFYWVAIG